MKEKYVILLLLIMPFAQLVFAQEDETDLRETLAWFPDGHLKFIRHIDFEEIYKDYPKEVFDDVYPGWLKGVNWKLPKSTHNSFHSFASCLMIENMRVVSFKRDSANIPKSSYGGIHDKDNVHRVVGEDKEYIVIRFDALDQILAAAVKKGELKQITGKSDRHKIYSYHRDKNDPLYRRGRITGAATLYCHATVSGELLVASSIKDLQQMIRTGLSGETPLFYDESISFFQEVFPYLGQSWILSASVEVAACRMLLEKELLDQESFDNMRQATHGARVRSFHWITEELQPLCVERSYSIFENEELAQKRYEQSQRMRASFKVEIPEDATEAFKKNKVANKHPERKTYVDKSWVITEEVKTVEDIKAANERRRVIRELNEEKQKEKEKSDRQ